MAKSAFSLPLHRAQAGFVLGGDAAGFEHLLDRLVVRPVVERGRFEESERLVSVLRHCGRRRPRRAHLIVIRVAVRFVQHRKHAVDVVVGQEVAQHGDGEHAQREWLLRRAERHQELPGLRRVLCGLLERLAERVAVRPVVDVWDRAGEPAERLAAEYRAGERDEDAENHGVFRCAIALVDLAEGGREEAVAAHGVHQAARGEVETHDAREHGTGDGDADEHLAERAEQLLRGDEQHPVTREDAVGPVRERGGGHGVVRGIDEAAEENGDDHDAADLFIGELELLRGLRNGIKADEGPRRDGEGREDGGGNTLSTGVGEVGDVRGPGTGGEGGALVKAPDRVHIDAVCLAADKRGGGQREHGRGQQRREDALHDAGLLHTPDIEQAEEDQNPHREQHLAEPDVKARDLVVEAELQDVGRAVQPVDDQADGR